MDCPTCNGKTLMIDARIPGFRWCERCGTLLEESAKDTITDVPVLVKRCREFSPYVNAGAGLLQTWKRLGIPECLTPPSKS